MSTKFIGKDGYQEIESLPFTRRKPQELNTAQKTVRFIKRAAALAAKSLNKINKKSNRKKKCYKTCCKKAKQTCRTAKACYADKLQTS